MSAAHFTPDGRRRDDSYPGDPAPLLLPSLDAMLRATSLTCVSAAEWRWREGTKLPRRSVPTSNAAMYHGGSGTVTIAGERHRVGPGSLVIIASGTVHDEYHDPGCPFHASSIHFHAQLHGGADLVAMLGFPAHLQLDPRRDGPLISAMNDMPALFALRSPGWESVAHAQLTVVLHHLLTHHGPAFTPTGTPSGAAAARLAPLLDRIERELPMGAVSVESLARDLDISAVALRRLFRDVTGHSPNRYVQTRRVDLACRLLRRNDDPVERIAAAVGLADAAVFHRLFKALMGITPTRYRAQIGEW